MQLRMQRSRAILYKFIASRSSHTRHALGSVLLLRAREKHPLCREEPNAGLFCLHETEPRLHLAMSSRYSCSKSICPAQFLRLTLPKMLSLLLPLLLGLNQGLDDALRLESCMELEVKVDGLVRQARDLHFSILRYGGGILEAHAHRRVTDKHGFEETDAPANEVPRFKPR